MRLWYLSHRRPAKAQASLLICAVSPEPSSAVSPQPSLFAHIMEVEEGSDKKNQTSSPSGWLRNEFTADEKYHNLMTWLNCVCDSKGFKETLKLSRLAWVFSVCLLAHLLAIYPSKVQCCNLQHPLYIHVQYQKYLLSFVYSPQPTYTNIHWFLLINESEHNKSNKMIFVPTKYSDLVIRQCLRCPAWRMYGF